MTVDEDLKAAFLDVRKAYRLLYTFHRRIFAMARDIDDGLVDFSFRAGESGYDYLKKWNPQQKDTEYWEALPYYTTVFKWAKCKDKVDVEKKSKHLSLSDRFFAIEVVVDEAGDDADDSDPATFGQTPEASKTVMRCFFGKSLKERDGVSIMDAWFEDVDDPQVAKRSKNGNFVLWREDIDLVSVNSKADVVHAVMDFISRAELALKKF